MTAFLTIDMGEVTRLTRAGRLTEAMALLQGQPAAVPSQASTEMEAKRRRPGAASARLVIDMIAPPTSKGAWTAPCFQKSPESGLSPGKTAVSQRHGLSETIRALRDRLPMMDSIPSLGEGYGSPRRSVAVPVPDGARFEVRTFANDAGSRSYKVYVPSGYMGQTLPVVVMLHGCTQSPDDFAAGTRMNELAEQQLFLVAYPEQPTSANINKCWNWFKSGDQQRGCGEPSLIAGIALEVVEEFSADPRRVYAAGLSAGGAAAAVMAATYPDVFAAVGVHSGLACGSANDMPSAFVAMKGGGALKAQGKGSAVPTVVFHGDADRTVSPINSDNIIAQAAPASARGRVVTHGKSAHGMSFTRTIQVDVSGREVLEQWVLHGAGHAWSGGSESGSFTDPRGPDASREMMRFFLAHSTTVSQT